jgi:hypothetical protein
MRRILTVAPIVFAAAAWTSCCVSAQRGSAHGGFSGHAASSFHGGFTGSGPTFSGSSSRGFAIQPRYGSTAPPRYNLGAPWNNHFSPMPQYSGARSIAPRLTAPGFAGNRASGALTGTAAAGGQTVPPAIHRRSSPRQLPAWPRSVACMALQLRLCRLPEFSRLSLGLLR